MNTLAIEGDILVTGVMEEVVCVPDTKIEVEGVNSILVRKADVDERTKVEAVATSACTLEGTSPSLFKLNNGL